MYPRQNYSLTKSVRSYDSNENPVFLRQVKFYKWRNVCLRSVLYPVFIWSTRVLKNHNLLENPWNVLIADTKWPVLLELIKNVRFDLRVNCSPYFIIHRIFPIPRVYPALSQTFIKLDCWALNINLMLSNYMIKLVLSYAIIPNFGVKFTQQNNEPIFSNTLLQNWGNLLFSFKRGKMFFSDRSTKNSLKKSLTVLRNTFIVSVKLSNCFFQKHGINLLLPDRSCKHRHFIEYRNIIINNDILYFTIFIKPKLINSVRT